MPVTLLRTAKSAAVGVLATGVDWVTLTALVTVVGLSPRVASPFGLILGIAAQFIGNKWFAFGDKSRAVGRQLAQFAAAEAIGFIANLVLFDLAIRVVPLPLLVVRMACQSLVYFGICMPLWSRIFRTREEASS